MMKARIKGHGGILFWMQRVAEEHKNNAISLIDRANLLHWQSYQFETMPEEVQNQVVKQLIEDMKELEWDDSLKEYFAHEMGSFSEVKK